MDKPTISKFEYLKGDKILWTVIILISILSIFPVYSASSNLEYIVNNGTTTSHIVKHMIFLVVGLLIMRGVGFIKYQYIGKLSAILLFITVILLSATFVSGQTIEGASASRWLKIPGTAISFQPSAFAYLTLMIYICRYLTKKISHERSVADHILLLFLPTVGVFLLVAKDNGSTALMIGIVAILVMLLGRLSAKYVIGFVMILGVFGGLFVVLALNTNLIGGSRVQTWKSRIEVYIDHKNGDALSDADKTKNYQVMQAKAAIVHGGLVGVGPGKSALKQTLPQSVSDFIFAIIVEEYGLVGAIVLISLYLIMLMRIVIVANKTRPFFGSLLVMSLGLMIFVQLAVNIAVAVNLIPVTGQPLPLISYGGTSILVTYIQLGIILSVSSGVLIKNEEGYTKKQSIEEINDIA